MAESRRELVQEMVAAWNRRDLEAALARLDPRAEYVNPPTAVEPGTRHGHEGVADVMHKQWEGLGPDARQEIEELHVVGDQLITAGRVTRSMLGSTTPLENQVALRWSFRGDRILRIEVLGAGSSFHTALRAAGVPGTDA